MKKTTANAGKEQKITKDMLIGELVQKYPDAAYFLVKEGIHCIGCGAAAFETVEQGLSAHGKTKKQIDDLLKKLNKEADK
ncbi:DUF1858 domain-containing protein [Candidatus Woesearchaeota archaeon]|nr:DUF1858 domain-containing protein [Candidatus Woesearchaeota archaeon]